MANEKANNLDELAYSGKYHYSLQEENRDVVREQGKKINRTLKKLKKISDGEERYREDETHPYITLPPKEAPPDLKLVKAYEEAEQACLDNQCKKKKKKWLPW